MTDLINDLFNYIPENSSVRDYKGYQQHREVLSEIRLFGKITFRLKTPWLFLVTDTSDEKGYGNNTGLVIKSDGSLEEILIDQKNRITIAGKKYANWISYF